MAEQDRKGRKAVEKKSVALKTLAVEYVPINSIHPNKYNPNRQSEHEFELLLRSMREDGFTQPIVADRATRDIVDGEHRWRAGGALGYSEVPVVFVDMSEEQRRIATLRHNRARGSEDVELSAAVLKDLRELGALDWAQDSLMLDDLEVSRMLDDLSAPEALAAEDYSAAWTPGDDGQVSGAIPQGQASMTPEALTALRRREEAERAATTEKERQQARRENDVYRLTLVFAGEESTLVRRILGDRPAERILALCRQAAEGHVVS